MLLNMVWNTSMKRSIETVDGKKEYKEIHDYKNDNI